LTEPIVTKEYCEDLGTKDEEGNYDYEYRYWVYWFDLDGRTYRARVYTHSSEDASVMHMNHPRPPQYDDDLQAIGAYLRQDADVRTVSTLSATGGFEPVIRFD
jgi:hypothetical protein